MKEKKGIPTSTDNLPSSWESWGNYVLVTLEKVEERVDDLESQINENNLTSRTDIVELKTKAGVVAAVIGVVSSLIVSILSGFIVYYITKSPNQAPTTPPIKVPHSYNYKLEILPQPKFEFRA